MPLKKIVCPNCGQSLTIDESLKNDYCPVCGASLLKTSKKEIKPLSKQFDNELIDKGLLAIKNKRFDELASIYDQIKDNESNEFYTLLFELVNKIKIDIVFNFQDMDFSLTNGEMNEDIKSRYYHYARKKYINAYQSTFDKIAGKYPDIPGQGRGKWERSRTAYHTKNETLSYYVGAISLIKNEYLERLTSLAKEEREETILYNINLFIDMVIHSNDDLNKYNKEISDKVYDDYKRSPNPGHAFKFVCYILLFTASFIGFGANLSEMIIVLTGGDFFKGIFGILMVSLSSFLYAFGIVVTLIKSKLLTRIPLLGASLIVGGLILVTMGIISDITYSSIWFNITTIIISFVVMLVSAFKMHKHLPENMKKNGTIIGDVEKLANESFVIDFKYHFTPYKGEKAKKVKIG